MEKGNDARFCVGLSARLCGVKLVCANRNADYERCQFAGQGDPDRELLAASATGTRRDRNPPIRVARGTSSLPRRVDLDADVVL